MDSIKSALAAGRVKLKFYKADGSIREMTGTTNNLLFTWISKSTKDKSNKPVDPNLLRIWDLDKNEWRSVKVDRIIEWTSIS